MEKEFTIKHIPSLDGLRGLAILWVIFHNAALDIALESGMNNGSIIAKLLAFISSHGWLGVQLFFVLSGFLITRILLSSKERHSPNLLKHFYFRRALRIFPIYYVFLFTCFALAIIIENPPLWLADAYDHRWWHIFYLNNWIQPFSSVGLTHLWSLAVEEQFYMFWPLIVLCLSSSTLRKVCFVLIACSIIFRIAITSYDRELGTLAAYVPTIARIDALSIGAILALIPQSTFHSINIRQIMRFVLIACSIYLLVVLVLQRNITRVDDGFYNLNQTICAVLFMVMLYYAISLRSDALYVRLLVINGLRKLGKYSYAMYLFHLPISLVIHEKISTPIFLNSLALPFQEYPVVFFVLDMILTFVITYCLAKISWQLIEQRALTLKRNFSI